MGRTLEITPCRTFQGEPRLPGDKSISHRALLLAALAEGTSRITGLATGWDILATREALRRFGVKIDLLSETAVTVGGVAGAHHLQEPAEPIPCLNSGTTARLLAGIATGLPGLTILTGDASLRQRPMRRIIEPLRETGAGLWGRAQDTRLPVCILGQERLRPFHYRLPVPSAQVKSALLLAGLAAEGTTTIEEPIPTRDHTETMLRAMGVDCRREGTRITLKGPAVPRAGDRLIPKDPSAGAVFAVGAAIHPGSQVVLRDVGLNPTRTGYLGILARMGADIEVLHREDKDGEPIGEVVVRGRGLRGLDLEPADIPGLIDEIPLLAIAMALAEGPSSVRGAAELRRKESDRLASLAQELQRFGLAITETPDGFKLPGGGRPIAPAWADTHGDHRIGLAVAILATAATGTTLLRESQWIDVSFPGFEAELRRLARA